MRKDMAYVRIFDDDWLGSHAQIKLTLKQALTYVYGEVYYMEPGDLLRTKSEPYERPTLSSGDIIERIYRSWLYTIDEVQ